MSSFWKEHLQIGQHGVKWLLWGSGVGMLAGIASAIFLTALNWATQTRLDHPSLIYALPVAGFGLGWMYHHYAGLAARGNHLVIEEIHSNSTPLPLRMAPMVLLGTVITHLFGGSAGREGTALQMGASLADALGRRLGIAPEDRPLLLMAGISGGFGSVFGTPIAGFVFGMEVQSVGKLRYDSLLSCLVAALVGDLTTRTLEVGHSHYPLMASVDIDPLLLLKIALAGVAFGLTSLLFIELTEAIKHYNQRWIVYPPLRPFLGGLIILALTGVVGNRDYLGLSLPLIQASVHGEDVMLAAFLLKLIFTAVTLGTGFLGGEVTPLFVIGSTLGYTMGRLLGLDPAFSAAVGFVSVFAGATNTPLACIMMGVELFGAGSLLYLATGCGIAYLASGHRSIYRSQRIVTSKTPAYQHLAGHRITDLPHQQG